MPSLNDTVAKLRLYNKYHRVDNHHQRFANVARATGVVLNATQIALCVSMFYLPNVMVHTVFWCVGQLVLQSLIFVLFITKILGHSKCGIAHQETNPGGFIHLAKQHNSFVSHARVTHRTVKLLRFA